MPAVRQRRNRSHVRELRAIPIGKVPSGLEALFNDPPLVGDGKQEDSEASARRLAASMEEIDGEFTEAAE